MNRKLCSRCQQEKPLAAFPWRWRAANIRQSACRECRRLENRRSYRRHAEDRRQKQRRRNQRQRQQSRQFLRQYLQHHPCVDCGEKDIQVLDIDPLDSERQLSISQIIARCLSLDRIKHELKSCVVRCANCRQRRRSPNAPWLTIAEPSEAPNANAP